MLKNAALLTRPTLARREAPFPTLRSRIAQTLNVPQGYAFGSSLAAALLTAFLSILWEGTPAVPIQVGRSNLSCANMVSPQPATALRERQVLVLTER
jgi:hypothetical protein